jgi:membrane protease YdiL (CAAX protease family)
MKAEIVPENAVKPGTILSEVRWSSVLVYIVFAFAISWTIWIGLGALGIAFTIRVSIGMFGPALAALLVRLIRHEGFADAGLRLVGRGHTGDWRMYIAAYLVPPILIALSIAVVLIIGIQHWAYEQNLQVMAQGITKSLTNLHQALPKGFIAGQLAQIDVWASIALAFTLAIPFNMIFTFGEEFGWRGYLLPRLAPLGGVKAAIITGIIWGLWHAPIIILNGYNYPGHPWLGAGLMIVFTVLLGMILAWLRFRSGSIWPSTLAHAAFNAQAGFGALLLSPADSLLRAPIGIIGLIPMFLFALWLALRGHLKAQPDQLTSPVSMIAPAQA